MVLLYTDPCFLQHETGNHPECPERLRQVTAKLEQTKLDQACTRPEWQPVSLERLKRVHEAEYAAEVRQVAERGGGRVEADTVVSKASYDVALRAAGAICDATERVVRSDASRALCLVRPPGHHALAKRPMGFCLFNNAAIAAAMATREIGLDRVLIVDWDVHHGNGTQDAFWTDGQVGFLSIHRWPFYPGSGKADETGAAAGLGATLNLPIEFGIKRSDYLKHLGDELTAFANRIAPDLVIVSAGFDSHAADPIGSLGLETEDFAALTKLVVAVAEQHAGGKLVSVLEGGYNTKILADCIALHLSELLGAGGLGNGR